MRKNDLVAEIYDAGIRGVAGCGGDYAAIVPLLPSGAGRRRAPSDLGRSADEERGGHLLRDRRLL